MSKTGMAMISESERRHLELAFDSSYAIIELAGLEGGEELMELRNRIIGGELDFDKAVQIILTRLRENYR